MILCLGEALVDLICERPVRSLAEADSFRPHFGGALANIAVASARAGAEVGLAGAAGEDEWGRWLRDQLESEGVDVRWFELLDGELTPIAFAIFDDHGEPSYQIYGDAIETAIAAIVPRLADAIATAEALVFSSTTLATPRERDATLLARELARDRGVRLCFDPNIRPNRWGGDHAAAIEASRELVPGSYVVRCNREEAVAIASTNDPRRAASELAAMGAELAVVTLGEEGAVIAGACEAEAPSPQVEVVSTVGAGDAFMGTLAAGLAARDWDLSRADEALGPALAAAAEACTRWGALD